VLSLRAGVSSGKAIPFAELLDAHLKENVSGSANHRHRGKAILGLTPLGNAAGQPASAEARPEGERSRVFSP